MAYTLDPFDLGADLNTDILFFLFEHGLNGLNGYYFCFGSLGSRGLI